MSSDVTKTVSQEDIEKAEALKCKANEYFNSELLLWLSHNNVIKPINTLGRSFKTQTHNTSFPEQDYNNAVEYYTKAIELNPNVAAYYGNRSFAYLKTECFGYALADASKAIELDKNYLKGYYRRAAAYMSVGKFKEALRDYERVCTNFSLLFVSFPRLVINKQLIVTSP